MKYSLASLIFAFVLQATACSTSSLGIGDVGGGQPDPPPAPQSPEILAPYLGRWENSNLTIILLPDARAAVLNRYSSSIPAEIGTYRVNKNAIDFDWLFSGKEHDPVHLSGNVLQLSIYDLQQTATDNEAQAAFDTIYQALLSDSETYNSRFAIGKASDMHDRLDPNPNRRNAGATVYTGEGLYLYDSFSTSGWEQLPNGQINVYDGYSRADMWLLPDGRACNQIWLWQGVDIHDQAHVKHILSWGQYSLTPGQNALEGDVVNIVFDNGLNVTYRMVGGRRFLKSREITYHNAALRQ